MGCFEDHANTEDHNTSITLYQIIKGIHPDDWVQQNNEMSRNRIRGMVSFALAKVIVIFYLAMSVGQSKNSEPTREIEPQTFRFPLSGASPLNLRDSTVSESSLWHASCILLVLKRLVNTNFIIVFVLVHLLSISVSLVDDYYTISLLSPINVPCK